MAEESGRSNKAKQLGKAARLLSQAVALLEDCGANIALDHSRKALAATDCERQIEKAAAKKVKVQKKACMPRNENALIREDGSLRYVGYLKQSGQRPEVISVIFRAPGLPSMTTSFTLVGREFDVVYAAAVGALVNHLGIGDEESLVAKLMSTSAAFKVRYGI